MKFCLALLLAVAGQVFAAETKIHPDVERIVKPFVASGEFSGVVLIQNERGIVHFNSYGMAVREHDVANKLDTVFRVGSISKQFVAALILHLQEQKLLNVHDPVTKFIGGPPQWDAITLHHLLTHTSGLAAEIPVSEDPVTAAAYHSTEELVESAKAAPLAFQDGPGKHFLYSNLGYSLLAAVIEKVTGTAYGDYVEKVISKDLGLAATGIDHDALIVAGRAQGYTRVPGWPDSRAIGFDLSNLLGAGDFRSTAANLSAWLDVLLNNRFLTEESRELMWRAHAPMENEGQSIPGLSYGYGWAVDQRGGRLRIVHNGSVPGFVSDLAWFPGERVRIIILSNIRNHRIDPQTKAFTPDETASLIRTRCEWLLGSLAGAVTSAEPGSK